MIKIYPLISTGPFGRKFWYSKRKYTLLCNFYSVIHQIPKLLW